MSALTPFRFDDKHSIRVTQIDGAPWFIAKEIADVLGYSDAEAMTRKLDDDEKQNLQIVGFGNRGGTVISEAGLYSAILTSQKPEAKRFKKWVTSEVLPSIRKTGSYALPSKTRPLANQSLAEVRTIDYIGNMLAKVPGSRPAVIAAVKLSMIEERTGIPANQFRIALPAEELDKAVKLNPTQLGKRLTPVLSAVRVNERLIKLGLQRKVENGYVLTPIGSMHGESRPFQAKNKHIGDQIDWYESVIELMSADVPATQPALI